MENLNKNVDQLIFKNRSYRRFFEDFFIDYQTLVELVNLVRLSPSARNAQPLKFILSNSKEKNEKIFPLLAWAGYLKDWNGPEIGERPSAYIVILGDHSVTDNFYCDHGIACQSILLGAVERELGGCIIHAVTRSEMTKIFRIPEHLEILLVIALGKPKETVIIEKFTGDIKYWRDEHQIHHVPKREVDDLILDI